MILVRGLRLEAGAGEETLRTKTAKKLRIPERDINELVIIKKSLDARKKDDIHWVYTVAAALSRDESAVIRKNRDSSVSSYKRSEYIIPKLNSGVKRPVIIGFGPAGMFAALVLSRAGARPLVLERGADVDSRTAAVELFRERSVLSESANIQFGEGGAGTFSDGKLNTGISDSRLGWVLEQFRDHGAGESITYDAKPHVGTDVLVKVVKNIRNEILNLGGEIRFLNKVTGIKTKDGKLTGVIAESPEGSYDIECSEAILAIGHSARDTFEMLYNSGMAMEQKPFSMGARIEHLQEDINRAQYGDTKKELPPADYSLNVHLPDGGSAYTFCMCPGGSVVAAASEEGGAVTNGMSLSDRDGTNANSALLVTLHTEDFPDRGVLSGMYWQREIEQAAYHYGGDNYMAPAQKVGDFLNNTASSECGKIMPSYTPGVIWGDIRKILPEKITCVLQQAIPELGKKLKGFDDPDAVLTAPETRSSSPVRILRNSEFEALTVSGLYPCGEGAGYAGGISSAAVDGVRCAEKIIEKLSQ